MAASFILTFSDTGDFAAADRAVGWLTECGFSVGRMQGRAPRGILFGLYDIQKWRNLSDQDRAELHGILYGNMRTGPVTVKLFDTAPDEAQAALRIPPRFFHSTEGEPIWRHS